MYCFKKAISIWGNNLHNEYNQVLGFRTDLSLEKKSEVTIALAARTYYRLYVNGKICANGPARTTQNYSRVDVLKMELEGNIKIALEIIALNKPEKYSNDSTLEPGMLTAEVSVDGEVVTATGDDRWRYTELRYRKSMVELMSHSRGIVEVYELDEHSCEWITGDLNQMNKPIVTGYGITYLERRSPYPTYRLIEMQTLARANDLMIEPDAKTGFVTELAKLFNRSWYELLKEEDMFIDMLAKEKEIRFSGTIEQNVDPKNGKQVVSVMPGANPAALTWSIPKSELGFISFHITVEEDTIVDIINSDHMNVVGGVKANSYGTRYMLKQGTYDLTTFEPKLTRYIKMIFRTKGKVEVSKPMLLDYSYPDDYHNSFECNDGELNLIYEGARRTLRLNTLDIFMDCPQRERGGWLCDSQFTAHGAWQLFGDLSVEKDFIENFMYTDADQYRNAFFPEVYPGCKRDQSDPGIENWSFWLLTELYDYYKRSGDKEFIEKWRLRVERFVAGVLSLRGESGLFDGLKSQFVDWSLSNKFFCLHPISIPNNCLIVHMLEEMAELYQVEEWKKVASEVRDTIESIKPSYSGYADSVKYENGKYIMGDCLTESGVALQLWSGFKKEDMKLRKKFVETMGTCPEHRADPNIGKANLFIGLMIRFDVLSKMGKIDTLVKELKDVYLPELIHGSGTMFENYAGYSGCHGFNAVVGALLVNDVLGLGQPMQLTKTIRICPHPGKLNWANGSARCCDGDIYLNWSADHDEHVLNMELTLPEGWKPEVEITFELASWTVILNGEIQTA